MVARPLLQRLEAVRGEVELTVLRPPTFDALREAVTAGRRCRGAVPRGAFRRARGDAGRSGSGGPVPAGHDVRAGEGVLAFEQPGGGSDLVAASKVAAVLAPGRVPVVVLNACQSGAVGKELEASVATALLQAGCAAVVAMAYSVYAVAAAEFMAAFYESLFTGASVGQAVTAGRRRLFEHDGRPSREGGHAAGRLAGPGPLPAPGRLASPRPGPAARPRRRRWMRPWTRSAPPRPSSCSGAGPAGRRRRGVRGP